MLTHPPLFTVFTPTHNRIHTLSRVYKSLTNQTLQDLEWLIIDDGSIDDTATQIRRWETDAPFPIRYHFQAHSGKHVAYNTALSLAHGRFLLTLDSDDACKPFALERLKFHWDSIPESDRHGFSGVTVLCCNETGHTLPDAFPRSPFDVNPVDLHAVYRISGEKWGFHLTDVCRKYPSPVIPGERYLTEGIVWNRIAKDYLVRCVNEPLRIYYTTPGGIHDSSRRLRMENPLGARLFYREAIASAPTLRSRIRHLVNYLRFSLHSRCRLQEAHSGLAEKSLLALVLPVACLAYLYDLGRTRTRKVPESMLAHPR